jgi:hypothetical protein
MYGQLDLKDISKFYQVVEKSPNFHEFFNQEFHCDKRPPKKIVICELYNLVDSMKSKGVSF